MTSFSLASIALVFAAVLGSGTSNPGSLEVSSLREAQDAHLSRQAEVVEELTKDVANIASPGTPGGVSVFGEEAWAIVANGSVTVVAAAERDGGKRGRIVAFTQGGYVEPGSLGSGDQRKFMSQVARWASGGTKRPTWAQVGGGGCPLATALGGKIAADWRKADVLVANTGNLTPARIAAVNAVLERGAGLLVGCTPWGWQQLTPDLRMCRDLTLNRVMEPFGLVFDHRQSANHEPDLIRAGTIPPALSHASAAFAALRDGTTRGDQGEVAEATVRAAIRGLSDFEPQLMLPLRTLAAQGTTPFAAKAKTWIEEEYERRGLRPLHERWEPWQVIGPFAAGRRGKELASGLRIEKQLEDWSGTGTGPDFSTEWKGAKGKVTWQQIELDKDGRDLDVGELDLEALIARGLTDKQRKVGWSERTTALLYRRVVIGAAAGPDGVNYDMRMAGDGGLRVWLDGVLVGEAAPPLKGSKDAKMPEARIVLHLNPGVHHLVVKVAHTAPMWRFQVGGEEGLDQTAVNAAIDLGVDHLIRHQFLDGSWAGYGSYGVGLTALNLFALAESGLPRDHPAIRRALAYLDAHPSKFVYSLGCEMLARAELDRGDQKLVLERQTRLMESWSEGTGLYAYPIHPSGSFLPDDVSNTLFAALAFSGAKRRGIDADPEVWLSMIDGTLQCMEREKAGASGKPPLGFSYRPRGTATGSMTTAALSILLMAKQNLGDDLKGRKEAEVDQAIERGVAWIGKNMTWESDPNGGWQYFFIYGIERLGSLLETDILGGIPWYDSGAEYLIRVQGEKGKWTGQQGDVDTALALLFLNRSTTPTSGDTRAVDWRLLAVDGDLGARARIDDGLEVWLTGLSKSFRETLEGDATIVSVQWIGRDERGEQILEEVLTGGAAERFAARLQPNFSGGFELIARATIQVGAEQAEVKLDSKVLEVPGLYTDRQLSYGGDASRNLLAGASASASSGKSKPADALDGDHNTNWICEPADHNPKWMAELKTAALADTLLITHRGPRPSYEGLSRVTQATIVINGTDTYELELERDLMRKSVLKLPEAIRVKRVEIQIQGFTKDASSGFSEVELLLESE
ncbi:MAG: hypothetical protein ACJAVJ_001035 [Planctomycetota bacterium]|jgi:hypothetical protein